MDQRSTIGRSVTLERPIHGACVVPGCWCGTTIESERSSAGTRDRNPDRHTPRHIEAASTRLTGIGLHSVGLPVV